MKAKSTLLDVVKELQSHDMLVTVAVTERRGHATELAAAAKQNGFDMVLLLWRRRYLKRDHLRTDGGRQRAAARVHSGRQHQ